MCIGIDVYTCMGHVPLSLGETCPIHSMGIYAKACGGTPTCALAQISLLVLGHVPLFRGETGPRKKGKSMPLHVAARRHLLRHVFPYLSGPCVTFSGVTHGPDKNKKI